MDYANLNVHLDMVICNDPFITLRQEHSFITVNVRKPISNELYLSAKYVTKYCLRVNDNEIENSKCNLNLLCDDTFCVLGYLIFYMTIKYSQFKFSVIKMVINGVFIPPMMNYANQFSVLISLCHQFIQYYT